MYHFLADVIVIIHLAYIAFVLGGLLVTVVGAVLRWGWIRNPWFRFIHLTMILIVALESAVEFTCPLTTWENQLRAAAGENVNPDEAFMSRLLVTVLHPSWASRDRLYVGCMVIAGLIVATFIFAPPRLRRRRAEAVQTQQP